MERQKIPNQHGDMHVLQSLELMDGKQKMPDPVRPKSRIAGREIIYDMGCDFEIPHYWEKPDLYSNG